MEDSLQIDIVFNYIRQRRVFKYPFETIKYTLVFLIQIMTYYLHHHHGIYLIFLMLPQRNKLFKQLINIGHVEITGHHQVATPPVILAKHGVTIFNFIGTM